MEYMVYCFFDMNIVVIKLWVTNNEHVMETDKLKTQIS